VSKNQGVRFIFADGSRVIFRLSGTGSVGATIRIYFEKYESDKTKLDQQYEMALKEIVNFGLKISDIAKFTNRDHPSVIT
jgi:phosphoglucomutase